MARSGHVVVMDAHNERRCQRALLLTRLLNLGIPLYLTRFPVRLSCGKDHEECREETSLGRRTTERRKSQTQNRGGWARVSAHEPPIVKDNPRRFILRSSDISPILAVFRDIKWENQINNSFSYILINMYLEKNLKIKR